MFGLMRYLDALHDFLQIARLWLQMTYFALQFLVPVLKLFDLHQQLRSVILVASHSLLQSRCPMAEGHIVWTRSRAVRALTDGRDHVIDEI